MDDDDTPAHAPVPSLHYDFFKWSTTLSLVAIGGIFSLVTQSQFSLRPIELVMIFIALGGAAAAGLVGAVGMVDAAVTGKDRTRTNRVLANIVIFLLGLGAGYFILSFVEKLLQ